MRPRTSLAFSAMLDSDLPAKNPVSAPDGAGLPKVQPDIIEQEVGVEIDNIVPTYGYQQLPMVGLGGSAGSIKALQAFFEEMPAESGMVFVVIMHLSPDHISAM